MKLALATLLAATFLLPSIATPADAAGGGGLTQLRGKSGCVIKPQFGVTPTERRLCAAGRFGGGQISQVHVSPDGRSAYVSSLGGGISVFARNNRTGVLRQLRGRAGCVTRTGTRRTCARASALAGDNLAISPDGRHVYAVGRTSAGRGQIEIFTRSRRTGALRRRAGAAHAGLLRNVVEIVVSADGRNVYAASEQSFRGPSTVVLFTRNPTTGALTATSCISGDGGSGCARARGVFNGCCRLAITSDGRNVYLASDRVPPAGSETQQVMALASFARAAATGALTQLPGASGCMNHDGSDGCTQAVFGGADLNFTALGLVPAPDNRDVYFSYNASFESEAGGGCGLDVVVTFRRDPGTGALSRSSSLGACTGIEAAMSADGRSLITPSGFGSVVTVLARDAASGSLRRTGCLSESAGGCARARALDDPSGIAISPNGRHVYAASNDGVAIFARRR